MGTIRVIVVDDSPLARALLVDILSSDREIEIAGEAENGQEAVEMVAERKPDLVTMDLEMPMMGGLEAIERIMAKHAVPILVVTNRGDSGAAHGAIERGALELVAKPDVDVEAAADLIAKVKLLAKVKVVRHIGRSYAKLPERRRATREDAPGVEATADRIVAIASSTGGPSALSVILSAIPSPFPWPVVVAQHHSDGFVPGMVEWFRRVSRVPVKVAEHGEPLVPGTVYVSPSERHLRVTASRRLELVERRPEDIYRPSCDALLSSVARSHAGRAVGVILTGMGSDGAKGMQEIRAAGGVTIAQDEATSAVFGMPRVAVERGCIDRVLPLEQISAEIVSLTRASGAAKAR